MKWEEILRISKSEVSDPMETIVLWICSALLLVIVPFKIAAYRKAHPRTKRAREPRLSAAQQKRMMLIQELTKRLPIAHISSDFTIFIFPESLKRGGHFYLDESVEIILDVLEEEEEWQIQRNLLYLLRQIVDRLMYSPEPGSLKHWNGHRDAKSLKRRIGHRLLTMLDSPEIPEDVQEVILTIAGKSGDIRLIPSIIQRLDERNPRLRTAAVNALRYAFPLVNAIVFGDRRATDFDPGYTLMNPEVAHLTVPMRMLRNIVIDSATYDAFRVEQFLTYALSVLGSKYLKKHVSVHVYGNINLLPANLRNNLTNLHKRVVLHEGGIVL